MIGSVRVSVCSVLRIQRKISFNTVDIIGEGVMQKFQAFLARASACTSLFSSPTVIPVSNSGAASTSTQTAPTNQHVILLEDIPNILHPTTQAAFHLSLQDLAHAPGVPIVLIVSDSGLRGEDAEGDGGGRKGWGKSKDVVDVRSVLGPLYGGQYVTQIGYISVSLL